MAEIKHYKHTIKKLSDLREYENNSRTHSEEQIAQVVESIKEFGFTNPLLIDDHGTIIAGHCRLEAAKRININELPCIVVDGLSDAQRRALVIADNQLALNAGWDLDMLKLEIEHLKELDFDIDLLGFDDDFIDSLAPIEISEGLTDEDDAPDVPDEPVSKRGDIWILGNHRLMCGDSTSIDDVEKLLDGRKADMVFTDPPYNVAFNGRSGKHDVIKNDDLAESEFADFIDATVNTIKAVSPKAYYIWCNWKFYGILQSKLDYKARIVWAKNVFGLGVGYRHQHEFCLFYGELDRHIKNESDLWEVKKDKNYVHPTQKPVALSVRAFSNHIKLINILDLFGGSGSTLIGAEQTGRNAFLMELDEKYCDVIIERWQNYTGKKAILESTGEAFDEVASKRGKA